jgi:hypothetical protein
VNLNIELPGIVRVRDTTNYKGNPVTVVSIFGTDVLYYIGKKGDNFSSFDNSDWEDIMQRRIADFFGDMLMKQFPLNWSDSNPTGREVSEEDTVYLTETRETDS